MKKHLGIIFSMSILMIPTIISASRVDDFHYSTTEKINLNGLFNDNDYTEFLNRYNLLNGDAMKFFQDSEIQEVITLLRDNKSSQSTIRNVFDLINDKIGIEKWEEGAFGKTFQLNKIKEILKEKQQNINTTTPQSTKTTNTQINTTLEAKQQIIYEYITRNCKKYTIVFLEKQEAYTSPNLKIPEYFISKEHLERYIDTKNPGTCNPKSNYYIENTFENKSNLRYIAPNGKIYYTDEKDGIRYSNETHPLKQYQSLDFLKARIKNENPQIYLK